MNAPDGAAMQVAVQLPLPWQPLCCCHSLIRRIGHDSQELSGAPPCGVVWRTWINVVIDMNYGYSMLQHPSDHIKHFPSWFSRSAAAWKKNAGIFLSPFYWPGVATRYDKHCDNKSFFCSCCFYLCLFC